MRWVHPAEHTRNRAQSLQGSPNQCSHIFGHGITDISPSASCSGNRHVFPFRVVSSRQNGLWLPFQRITKKLSKAETAQVFEDYKDAINVLKHGKGPSYERLLKKTVLLEFRVKPSEAPFFSRRGCKYSANPSRCWRTLCDALCRNNRGDYHNTPLARVVSTFGLNALWDCCWK